MFYSISEISDEELVVIERNLIAWLDSFLSSNQTQIGEQHSSGIHGFYFHDEETFDLALQHPDTSRHSNATTTIKELCQMIAKDEEL